MTYITPPTMARIRTRAEHPVRELWSPAHSGDATNALRYIVDAYNEEPLFVVRGRDVFAIPTMHSYLRAMDEHGLNHMAAQAARHLSRVRGWQNDNARLLKIPDAYPGWQRSTSTGTISVPRMASDPDARHDDTNTGEMPDDD